MAGMRLVSYPERADPDKLAMNVGIAFVGTYVLGMGFILTPDERDTLVKKNKRNAQRIFPYLGGQEVNSSPTQDFDRYVISFGEMSLEEAEAWPDLLAIVREKVKPGRDKLKDNTDGKDYKARWWQFAKLRRGLVQALAPLSRCLVNSQVTKHLVFAFQPTDRIFGHTLYAYPLDHCATFAVLQSRVHEPWARLLSSTMGRDNQLRYSASDCFDTFPFPGGSPRAHDPDLEAIGQELYEYRAGYMVETNQGLTKVYNNPPNRLRELHDSMDRAVLHAYGWDDIDVPRYPEPLPITVIDRLYDLNRERSQCYNSICPEY